MKNSLDNFCMNSKKIGSRKPKDYIDTRAFWDKGYKGNNIVVAVIDTGCEIKHIEIQDNIIDGYNFLESNESNIRSYNDDNGHGTHVAGIIAGKNIGIAPNSKILALKVLDRSGSGSVNNLIRSINYAIEWTGPNNEKVRIISISLGSQKPNNELYAAIKRANRENISVVVASGNEGDGTRSPKKRYPGYYNEVIQVGALHDLETVASFSNNNDEIDLVAPGYRIYSSYINNEYKELSGTSMAAPFVAGSLALIINAMEDKFNRSLTETEVYAQLIKRTKPITGNCMIEGNGSLNLFI
ncbi:S8 family peptidase [Priestia aryabhattai]|uniref:S8 family peptidase n=1 Tax=Priestia aryabhattai TaxID=412384 RepID=UPI002E1BE4B2|nr:S8 family peptidase [Priestia aryabhattai]